MARESTPQKSTPQRSKTPILDPQVAKKMMVIDQQVRSLRNEMQNLARTVRDLQRQIDTVVNAVSSKRR